MGYCGIPKAAACIRPPARKSAVQTVTVGMPCFSSAMASCTLHEMHEPQAPMAVITQSQVLLNSSMSDGGARRE